MMLVINFLSFLFLNVTYLLFQTEINSQQKENTAVNENSFGVTDKQRHVPVKKVKLKEQASFAHVATSSSNAHLRYL